MSTNTPPRRSHLFTVRVWLEEIEQGRSEWRGKVQLMTSGEVRYFHGWKALVPLLLTMLSESHIVFHSDESVEDFITTDPSVPAERKEGKHNER